MLVGNERNSDNWEQQQLTEKDIAFFKKREVLLILDNYIKIIQSYQDPTRPLHN